MKSSASGGEAILQQTKVAEQVLKKLNLCTKLFLRQYIKVFTSKSICINLYLLFITSITYLQSTTKVFFTTGISY